MTASEAVCWAHISSAVGLYNICFAFIINIVCIRFWFEVRSGILFNYDLIIVFYWFSIEYFGESLLPLRLNGLVLKTFNEVSRISQQQRTFLITHYSEKTVIELSSIEEISIKNGRMPIKKHLYLRLYLINHPNERYVLTKIISWQLKTTLSWLLTHCTQLITQYSGNGTTSRCNKLWYHQTCVTIPCARWCRTGVVYIYILPGK